MTTTSSIVITPQARDLIAADALGRSGVALGGSETADPRDVPAGDAVEAAPAVASDGPFAPLKLRRDGARPLEFNGALAVRLASPGAHSSAGAVREPRAAHRLELYLTDEARVVVSLAGGLTIEAQPIEDAEHATFAATILDNAAQAVAFLDAHAPEAIVAAPSEFWSTVDDPDALARTLADYEARIAAARADFAALRMSPILSKIASA